jgi:hypothetical protein
MTFEQYLASGYILVEFIIAGSRSLPMLLKFEQHYFCLAWAHEDYRAHFTGDDGSYYFDWDKFHDIYPELRELSFREGSASMAFPYCRLLPFFVPGTYAPSFELDLVSQTQTQIQDDDYFDSCPVCDEQKFFGDDFCPKCSEQFVKSDGDTFSFSVDHIQQFVKSDCPECLATGYSGLIGECSLCSGEHQDNLNNTVSIDLVLLKHIIELLEVAEDTTELLEAAESRVSVAFGSDLVQVSFLTTSVLSYLRPLAEQLSDGIASGAIIPPSVEGIPCPDGFHLKPATFSFGHSVVRGDDN